MKHQLIALILIGIVVNVTTPNNSYAREYQLPDANKRLIGQPVVHTVKQGDYFQALAEQFNVGFLALMAANTSVDPFLPKPGTELNIPTQMLLPYGERDGIVINLPELRLYYFLPDSERVVVFPVGIGRLGLATPRTTSYIGEKRENPSWRPTEDMKARHLKEKGVALADEIPPGPNNPFGKYALRLGTSQYLIHGTNQRFGIGMRASSGCIRLYDDDIKWLYDNVPRGTQVKIIDQPLKMSYEAPGLKMYELHEPLTADGEEDLVLTKISKSQSYHRLAKFLGVATVDKLKPEYKLASGLVTKVKSKNLKAKS